jgi:hypothetical protein
MKIADTVAWETKETSSYFVEDFIDVMENRFYPENPIKEEVNIIANSVANYTTYTGVVLLLVPGSQVVGMIVTVIGGVATSVALATGGSSTKYLFRKTLSDSISNGIYDLIYTSGTHSSMFGATVKTCEWEEWGDKYIFRYKYQTRLDIENDISIVDVSQYAN